jgi:hypothetical protein
MAVNVPVITVAMALGSFVNDNGTGVAAVERTRLLALKSDLTAAAFMSRTSA